MSKVVYGDVTLQLLKVNSFTQEVVYTDDGADYLYTKYTVDVTAMVSKDQPTNDGSTIASQLLQMRSTLLAPRQPLTITIDGATLLQIPAPDTKAGPFPKSCTVTQITGSRSALVTYLIECHSTECYQGSQPISNRWRMETTYDENFFATRRTTGKIVISAQVGGVNADNYRLFAMPALPTGYKRMRASFHPSGDGLQLEYSIEDKEVYRTAPPESTTATGTYTETTEKHGTYTTVEIDLHLTGHKEQPKVAMIQRAATIVLSRLILNAGVGNSDMLISMSLSEELWENSISLRVVVWRTSAAQAIGGLIKTTKIALAVPGTQGNTSVDLFERDPNSLLTGAISAWKSPCEVATAVGPVYYNPQYSADPGLSQTVVEVSPGSLDSTGEPSYSDDHKYKLYTDYEIERSYETDQNKIQLPIASVNPANNETATSVVISLAPPTQKMILKGHGERIGAWPAMPYPVTITDDENFELLDKTIAPEAPQLMPNGTDYKYTISFEYVYSVKKPRVEGYHELGSGHLPLNAGNEADNKVPVEVFQSNIATPSGA